MSAPRTVVVHHRSGIGDLVWHIPYFRAVAAGSAGGRVSVIARPSSCAADLLSAEPSVEQVIEYDRRPRPAEGRRGRHDSLAAQFGFIAELRRQRFERIVIFSGRVRYGVLAWLAGIPQRAGFGFSAAERLFLNQPPYIRPYEGPGSWVYPELTAFALAHGFAAEPLVPRLTVPEPLLAEQQATLARLPQPRYALAIGASEPRKRWESSRFAELAAALAARDAGVLLLGGPAEREAAEQVRAAVPAELRPRIAVLVQPSVLRSAAALHACDHCIGNDTGMLNIAAAVGRPCLGLFGATPPLAHDPLLQGVSGDGMAAIQVSDVLARLAALGAPGFASREGR